MKAYKTYNLLQRLLLVIPIIILIYLFSCEEIEYLKKPDVKTVKIENPTVSSVEATGEIVNLSKAKTQSYGFCWSVSENPAISDNVINLDLHSLKNIYKCVINEFEPGKQYYIRAFATNEAGIGYGKEINFTTAQSTSIPTVTTASASSVTETSAAVGGNVTAYGGATVTEKGVYYGTSSNPESTGTKVQIGSGTGSFSKTITGLTANTTYYVKAYAKNSEGTAYGSQGSFTTTQTQLSAPTGVSASNGTYTDKVRITWNGVNGASYYRVYRNTSNSSSSASAVSNWQSGTSYDNNSVTPGTTYYYWVKAATSNSGANASNYSSSNSGYAFEQTTVYCYPSGASQSTGRVDMYGKYDDLIRVGKGSALQNIRGWATFDVSSIPNNATIIALELRIDVQVSSTSSNHNIDFCRLTIYPNQNSASAVRNDIDNGICYDCSSSSEGTSIGYKYITLNSSAISYFQSTALDWDWFGVGMREYEGNDDDCDIYGYSNSSYKPRLPLLMQMKPEIQKNTQEFRLVHLLRHQDNHLHPKDQSLNKPQSHQNIHHHLYHRLRDLCQFPLQMHHLTHHHLYQ